MDPSIYEQLGQFYLGRDYDPGSSQILDVPTLYDARDLTTHAVCVGMTGSGKTGLCVTLLEEAAIDGVPALVIDPKGDLTNLLLTFPDLAPADFEPWVDPDEARRRGMTVEAFAADQAELWRTGLGRWGQDGARIARLREAAEILLLTPGSTAGVPVSILGSFAAPPPGIREDAELVGDRVASTVTPLLALLGVDADPLRSREHILVSTILQEAWSEGRDLDLESLIHRIQRPPVSRVGVLDLESFFPSSERFRLATRLNNLLAAPGFQSWLQGVPLDAGALLRSPQGRPRVAIFSIAHLSDAERMFFVSLLLNETLGWMRGQSGTSSLRALLYIDEILGFMPPVAEPPSKKPLLTLLKQARAFGLGVVLATQNPVDLDYKGLSNAGTWFVGRLQTQRDRSRVLGGLESASNEGGGSFDEATIDRMLAGLGKRVFLLHNVHEQRPRIFHTRWAMSYLRGPLLREQIRRLTREGTAVRSEGASRERMPVTGTSVPGAAAPGAPASGWAPDPGTTSAALPGDPLAGRPVLPPDVPEVFVRPGRDLDGADLRYVPTVLGLARIHYQDGRRGVEYEEPVTLVDVLTSEATDVAWEEARPFGVDEEQLEAAPLEGASFAALPSAATEGRRYQSWARDLRDHLFHTRGLELFRSDVLDEVSRPGESERDFRIRLSERLREHRDDAVDALRRSFEKRIARARESVRRAEAALDAQEDQAHRATMDAAISVGEGLLSAFVGRRRRGGLPRAGRTARRISRGRKEARDVDRAEEVLRSREGTLDELERELRLELDAIRTRLDPASQALSSVRIRPRQRDVDVRRVVLAWVPIRRA